jgi:maltose alpha-D-glucosyltransferase/alpha-amylase
VFGLGTYEPLEPSNSRIFAHVRSLRGRRDALRHNLARSGQAVELDLSASRAASPSRSSALALPAIGELPYLLTLAPRGFYWFQLVEDEDE